MRARGKRWRVWAGWLLKGMALGFVACVGVSLFLTIFPRPWRFERRAEQARILAELPHAEARWAQSGITDYDVEIRVFGHSGTCYIGVSGPPGLVQMREGEPLLIQDERQRGRGEDCSSIEELVPPRVFATLREWLVEDDGENVIHVAFDSRYGYVTDYHISGRVNSSTLNTGYSFSNLHPITDTIPSSPP